MIEEYEKQSRVYFYLSEDNFSCCCQIMSWKERKVKMLKKNSPKLFEPHFENTNTKFILGKRGKFLRMGPTPNISLPKD